MVATPGSGGSGSGARAMTYRDKTVKAHDEFWPEVDKVEPILTSLESQLDELSQSQLTQTDSPGPTNYDQYELRPL